jgi:hypothetical protein
VWYACTVGKPPAKSEPQQAPRMPALEKLVEASQGATSKLCSSTERRAHLMSKGTDTSGSKRLRGGYAASDTINYSGTTSIMASAASCKSTSNSCHSSVRTQGRVHLPLPRSLWARLCLKSVGSSVEGSEVPEDSVASGGLSTSAVQPLVGLAGVDAPSVSASAATSAPELPQPTAVDTEGTRHDRRDEAPAAANAACTEDGHPSVPVRNAPGNSPGRAMHAVGTIGIKVPPLRLPLRRLSFMQTSSESSKVTPDVLPHGSQSSRSAGAVSARLRKLLPLRRAAAHPPGAEGSASGASPVRSPEGKHPTRVSMTNSAEGKASDSATSRRWSFGLKAGYGGNKRQSRSSVSASSAAVGVLSDWGAHAGARAPWRGSASAPQIPAERPLGGLQSVKEKRVLEPQAFWTPSLPTRLLGRQRLFEGNGAQESRPLVPLAPLPAGELPAIDGCSTNGVGVSSPTLSRLGGRSEEQHAAGLRARDTVANKARLVRRAMPRALPSRYAGATRPNGDDGGVMDDTRGVSRTAVGAAETATRDSLVQGQVVSGTRADPKSLAETGQVEKSSDVPGSAGAVKGSVTPGDQHQRSSLSTCKQKMENDSAMLRQDRQEVVQQRSVSSAAAAVAHDDKLPCSTQEALAAAMCTSDSASSVAKLRAGTKHAGRMDALAGLWGMWRARTEDAAVDCRKDDSDAPPAEQHDAAMPTVAAMIPTQSALADTSLASTLHESSVGAAAAPATATPISTRGTNASAPKSAAKVMRECTAAAGRSATFLGVWRADTDDTVEHKSAGSHITRAPVKQGVASASGGSLATPVQITKAPSDTTAGHRAALACINDVADLSSATSNLASADSGNPPASMALEASSTALSGSDGGTDACTSSADADKNTEEGSFGNPVNLWRGWRAHTEASVDGKKQGGVHTPRPPAAEWRAAIATKMTGAAAQLPIGGLADESTGPVANSPTSHSTALSSNHTTECKALKPMDVSMGDACLSQFGPHCWRSWATWGTNDTATLPLTQTEKPSGIAPVKLAQPCAPTSKPPPEDVGAAGCIGGAETEVCSRDALADAGTAVSLDSWGLSDVLAAPMHATGTVPNTAPPEDCKPFPAYNGCTHLVTDTLASDGLMSSMETTASGEEVGMPVPRDSPMHAQVGRRVSSELSESTVIVEASVEMLRVTEEQVSPDRPPPVKDTGLLGCTGGRAWLHSWRWVQPVGGGWSTSAA